MRVLQRFLILWGVVFITLLLSPADAAGQTRKQISEAFTGGKQVKLITYYCKNRKIYNRKVKRLLRILDQKKIYSSFKVRYQYSETNYFTFNFKSYYEN